MNLDDCCWIEPSTAFAAYLYGASMRPKAILAAIPSVSAFLAYTICHQCPTLVSHRGGRSTDVRSTQRIAIGEVLLCSRCIKMYPCETDIMSPPSHDESSTGPARQYVPPTPSGTDCCPWNIGFELYLPLCSAPSRQTELTLSSAGHEASRYNLVGGLLRL